MLDGKFYIPMLQTSNVAVLLIFPVLSMSGIHKVPLLKFKGEKVT